MVDPKINTGSRAEEKIERVLLFGVQNDLALSAIRALKIAFRGLKIFTVSNISYKGNVSEWSRYVAKSYHCESSVKKPKELIKELKKIIKLCKPQIMVPIEEWHVLFMAENIQYFENLVKVPPLSKPEILNSVILKDRLSNTLNDAELPHANIQWIAADDGQNITWDEFPCIMKPVYGYSFDTVAMVHSPEEVRNKIRNEQKTRILDHDKGYILQEYIPGYNIDCSIIAKNGEVRVSTVQKGIVDPGLRYSSAIMLLHSEEITEYVKILVAKIGFEGIAHLDFRYDERDNHFKLIDFNARIWFTLLGSLSVGVNFMYYLMLSAINEPYPTPEYEEGLYFAGQSAIASFIFNNYSKKESLKLPVRFDLKYRIFDPLPDIITVWKKIIKR